MQIDDRFDVTGIGNALVDVVAQVSEEFLDEWGLEKGSMSLIDEARRTSLYAGFPPGIETSGGSVANSIAGVSSFGHRGAFMGRVRNDQLGDVFGHDLRSIGVHGALSVSEVGDATGTCLVAVTPDAERTLSTFLGAAAKFTVEDVRPDVLAASRYVFLEGYLFDEPDAQEAFRAAGEIARNAKRSVVLTLSDSFCVERHHAAFVDLCAASVDVVFANAEEARLLTGEQDLDAVIRAMGELCEYAIITNGASGALIVVRGEATRTPSVPVENVVDTTGAGDAFAAGYLAGMVRNESIEVSARLGAAAASATIAQWGPRPPIRFADFA